MASSSSSKTSLSESSASEATESVQSGSTLSTDSNSTASEVTVSQSSVSTASTDTTATTATTATSESLSTSSSKSLSTSSSKSLSTSSSKSLSSVSSSTSSSTSNTPTSNSSISSTSSSSSPDFECVIDASVAFTNFTVPDAVTFNGETQLIGIIPPTNKGSRLYYLHMISSAAWKLSHDPTIQNGNYFLIPANIEYILPIRGEETDNIYVSSTNGGILTFLIDY